MQVRGERTLTFDFSFSNRFLDLCLYPNPILLAVIREYGRIIPISSLNQYIPQFPTKQLGGVRPPGWPDKLCLAGHGGCAWRFKM